MVGKGFLLTEGEGIEALTSCGMVFRKLLGISLCLRFSRTWDRQFVFKFVSFEV